MTEHPKKAKRWLRFSLGTLLFASLCIGGLLGGYQSGYRSGNKAGQASRYDNTQITETYSTMNLIWPDLPADERTTAVGELKDLIQTTIATEIWASPTSGVSPSFRASVPTPDSRIGQPINKLPHGPAAMEWYISGYATSKMVSSILSPAGAKNRDAT